MRGSIFGFVTEGKIDATIYRFGKTTRTKRSFPDIFLDRMFTGLNRPKQVVMFEEVSDVTQAWSIVHEFLRDHSPRWNRDLKVTQETRLGDLFFTANCSTEEFQEHLKGLCDQALFAALRTFPLN